MDLILLIGIVAYLLAGLMIAICLILDVQYASKTGIHASYPKLIIAGILLVFAWPITLVVSNIIYYVIKRK